MKTLATRIFLAFFASLVLTGIGAIALTSWVLAERAAATEGELIDAAQAAADALAEGGRAALVDWTGKRAADPDLSLTVFVLDDWGVELLGRKLPIDAPNPPPATEEDWSSDIPAVLLNLPRESPVIVGTDGEAYRLRAVPRRAGLAAWRDLPLQLMALALAVTALVSLLLARSITRPIASLQRTTEALASGGFEARVDAAALRRRDEIGGLARSLDIMAGRLGSLIRSQRQLLRDVSHEVRSPLARIRLATGLLAQRDPAPNPALTRIDDEVTRLDRLIDSILDVSRLESGSMEWRLEPMDLRAVTERILADAAFEASQLGIRLETRITESAMPINGDRHWVESAVENVVRNALRHTARGTCVTVSLDRNEHTAFLRVSDTGPGLEETELQRIFEPFYRGGQSAGTKVDGAGLGLAIVARVMQGHGGTISANNRLDADGKIIGLELVLGWPIQVTPYRADRTANAPASRDSRSRE